MALILDTQLLIWIEEKPANISFKAREIISAGSVMFFSKVSVWEMAIKIKTGKLTLRLPLDELVHNFINDYSIHLLDISLDHIYYTQQLPLHHRDPFDRLLIAQTLSEDFSIISSDKIFDDYGVKRIW